MERQSQSRQTTRSLSISTTDKSRRNSRQASRDVVLTKATPRRKATKEELKNLNIGEDLKQMSKNYAAQLHLLWNQILLLNNADPTKGKAAMDPNVCANTTVKIKYDLNFVMLRYRLWRKRATMSETSA